MLHPGNEGYRLLLLASNGAKDGNGGSSEIELLKFPYEEDYLLNCIDAQARVLQDPIPNGIIFILRFLFQVFSSRGIQ